MVPAALGTYCGWSLRARGFGHGAGSYVAATTAAARGLVEDGLMLEEDVERTAAAAADCDRPRHDIRLK
jgi:hypothetical protein